MGCANSKVDDLPAVALCRDRCSYLDDAIRQRYVLAETHIAYIHALKQMGQSLHTFINNHENRGVSLSPQLNLPPTKKGGNNRGGGGGDAVGVSIQETTTASAGKGGSAHHSHSNSGSHIHFHSDPEDDSGSDSGSISFSNHSSPLHDHDSPAHVNYMNPDGNYMMSTDHETLGPYMHMNYMKREATPSVVYEQKPFSSETIRNYRGESSSSSYYPYQYPYPYPGGNNLNPNPGPYPYQSYPPNYGGGGGGYYGFPPPYGSSSSPPAAAAVASSSKPPPPPPSPPRATAWDFLNLFESNDKFYSSYPPSRDSKELREEEGIPDLEDEEYQHEVVKKVHGDEKFVDSSGGGGGDDKSRGDIGNGGGGGGEAPMYQRNSFDNEGVEYEVHVVDKKVVDEERNEEHQNTARASSRDPADVAREIEAQFVRASDSGTEIAKILEVGRLPYHRKHVASKMLHVVTPSLSVVSSQPSTSKSAETSSSSDKAGPAYLDIDEDVAMRARNLSATLQKLHLWEKKLYHEVKAEEKMRVDHDRKVRKLKHLDERGAEAHKVDSTRTLIRSLSTKIRIAIQIVDKISVTISKIRDEELWPQLNELIQGLTRMWKSMLECHHIQCQAIREAKGLGPLGSSKKHGDTNLETTSQFERELVNWIYRFSSWIAAQKGFVKALNNWLMKCLLYEPEKTDDGIVPFSPGRMGAPLIFVICYQWSQAMDRISEKEVIDAMRVLVMGVLQLWEQDKQELRQNMVVSKETERTFKNLDREDQKMHKEIQALDKKIVLVSGDGKLMVPGDVVYQSDTTNSNLQVSLQRIFEAMERFTAESVKAYEELLQRCEEIRLARDGERVS